MTAKYIHRIVFPASVCFDLESDNEHPTKEEIKEAIAAFVTPDGVSLSYPVVDGVHAVLYPATTNHDGNHDDDFYVNEAGVETTDKNPEHEEEEQAGSIKHA